MLRKHKDTNARFRLVTDVDPRSITDVLRKAIDDPGFAWHIRDLEITSARAQWSHWENTETEGNEDSAAVVAPDWAFTHDEQVALFDHLREIFHFDEQAIDIVREDLHNGSDAPLKLLLFGFCPRIRSVKFTRNVHLTGKGTLGRESTEDLQNNPRSSLDYFNQAILIHIKAKITVWPMGFGSLQEVAIGVDTGDKTSDVPFVPSPLLVTSCMNLPHLVSLYCFGLEMPWNSEDSMEDSRTRYNISKGSSSVQHLFLEGAHGDRTTQEVIVSGYKALKSLTISTCDMDDIDTLVALLKDCYKKCFESLMFYTSDPRMRLHGYRRSVFETEVLAWMPNLRMLWIHPEDVIQDADFEYMSDMRWEQLANKHTWWCLEDVDFFVEFFMRNALPDSTEVLVLGSQSSSPLSEEEAEFFDHAIAALIEFGAANYLRERWRTCSCGRHPPPEFIRRSLPNPIKAVYLEAMDQTDRHRGRRRRWFSKAIAAGRKHGVDVHTRTTRGPLFHQIEFPRPPLMASSGPASSLADGSLVFNVYSGKWGPPGCGNCGKCEACLEQYDASVWKDIEDELAQQTL